jgi:signal transduction histidine kinase
MLRWGHSLRAKIILILAGVVVVYAGLDALVQRLIIYPSFERLEEQGASHDLERVREAFTSELTHLELRSLDWTLLPEVKSLMRGERRPKGVLDTSILRHNRMHLLMVCAEDGRVLWGGTTLDPLAEVPQYQRFQDFPMERLSPGHPLLARLGDRGAQEVISGLMGTEHGALLAVARRFRTEAGSVGTILIGRLLTSDFVAALSRQTGVPFTVRLVEDPPADPLARSAFDEATASEGPVMQALSEDRLSARLGLSDLQRAPIAVVEAQLERGVMQRGSRAMQYALSSTLAAGLLMMLVLLYLLQRAVLKPIDALTRHALEVGRNDSLTRRLNSRRSDEIGVLAREFDSMVEKLELSRAELLQTARAAGMSEIANGVLHNVGNVLNSVSVSAAVVSEQLTRSGVDDLQRVIATIRKSGVPLDEFVVRDPRGKHLDPLLEQIAGQLLQERERVRGELGSLSSGIEHIGQLIASQQSVAGQSGVMEIVRLETELQRALDLTRSASGSQALKIQCSVTELDAIRVDRHRMMQILTNLVLNARQSLAAANGVDPRLVIRARVAAGERVEICVEDNGLGIAPENMTRIFNHGFTTRSDGHGFGLHSCANAAGEMGGRLYASSDGAGKGAVFTLEIPLQRVEALVTEKSI